MTFPLLLAGTEPEYADPPVVETTSTGSTASGTSHALTLPTGVVANNIVLCNFTTGPESDVTIPDGWTLFPSGSQTGYKTYSMWRRAAAAESGTITVTSAATTVISYHMYRVSGAHRVTAPEAGSITNSWNGNHVAAAFNPTNWGYEDTLWFYVDGSYGGTWSSGPAGWTRLLTTGTATIHTAYVTELTAEHASVSSSYSAAVSYSAWLIAIRPEPTPITLTGAVSFGWSVSGEATRDGVFGWSVSGELYSGSVISGGVSFGWGVDGVLSRGMVGVTHHLQLANEYLMVRSNTYQKKKAPTFGARITTGDPDYNNLSIWQHWVQKCWVGGMGAERWTDPEMFEDAIGLDTTVHEKVSLSRYLDRGVGSNWGLGGSSNVLGYKFIVFGDVLYCLVKTEGATPSRLYSYSVAGGWTSVVMPGTTFNARTVVAFNGSLFLGGTESGVAKVYYAATPGTWSLVTNPAGVPDTVTCFGVFNQRLYVAYGPMVWRLKDDRTWDGNTVFYTANANSGSNYITAMEVHLGYLYMLSQNGHLHRTDGNNTFDIWSWDGQTAGVSLRSYDNKLFVGTYEFTDTPDVGFGVLYQFTGAAVTELKRWGKVGKATSIGGLTVYGRRLYYGASSLLGEGDGFGVAMYDSVTDGHSIYAVQMDTATYPDASGIGTAWLVDDVFVFGGKLFAATRGYGVFATQDSFRDAQNGLARYLTRTEGGTMTSSLYDAGTPGLQKLWQKIMVHCAVPDGTSFSLAYSLDNGATWVNAVNPNNAWVTVGEQHTIHLNNVRSTQFKWRITLASTVPTLSPTLRGVVVAYLPQPEPNWMWTFTVPIMDKWQLLDGSEESKDTNRLIALFEQAFRDQDLIRFVDIDGKAWAEAGPGVLIYDLSVVHYDIESPNREADLRFTLLETVESYA